jgi:hypothetical protein
MEALKQKTVTEKGSEKESDGKAIRISLFHREILDKGRAEINKDTTYNKKISYSRYVEKLIEDHWEGPIAALKKEREGSKDWLEMQHKREAPHIPFFDWLRANHGSKPKKATKKVLKDAK